MKRYLSEDSLVLLSLLLIAISLLRISYSLDFSDVGNAHSPVFFPRIILVIWIALTAAALVKVVLQPSASDDAAGFQFAHLGRLALLGAAVLLFSNLITILGFFLSSLAFSAVCLPVFGIRNPLVIGLYSVIVPGSLVVLFNHVLGMPLPTSPFTHYF